MSVFNLSAGCFTNSMDSSRVTAGNYLTFNAQCTVRDSHTHSFYHILWLKIVHTKNNHVSYELKELSDDLAVLATLSVKCWPIKTQAAFYWPTMVKQLCAYPFQPTPSSWTSHFTWIIHSLRNVPLNSELFKSGRPSLVENSETEPEVLQQCIAKLHVFASLLNI